MGFLSKRNVILLLILTIYLISLFLIYLQFPELKREEREHFRYPRNLEDAKSLGRILLRYKERHFLVVLAGVSAVYLMLQSFAIPGSIFLTILSGYLFSFPVALALVCLCSAAGATVCYFISYMFGKRLIVYYFPARLALWQIEVQKQGDHLLNYIIFLRITPILPNWFINLASPIVDVPLVPFFFGTLLGVAPPSFLFIQAGTTLQMMTNANVVWSWNSILLLSFFAILSLAPVLYKRQMLIRSKEEEKNKLIKSE
ncbi:unnamed protein product [Meloidogyne enterolobii]|uniref:VTT domain-containing protein n=3 Tax=Meloidogyne TaxID=189290 RepID=A0A6V7XF40_MELEN|nr:unnamed protein product [Meloidogyne enterolobii]CAD2163406.1 unnamed protein product [Meloidogyne enterolobii]CAD2197873.1 unnamed protein product [Meloidogyne enterolobii]